MASEILSDVEYMDISGRLFRTVNANVDSLVNDGGFFFKILDQNFNRTSVLIRRGADSGWSTAGNTVYFSMVESDAVVEGVVVLTPLDGSIRIDGYTGEVYLSSVGAVLSVTVMEAE